MGFKFVGLFDKDDKQKKEQNREELNNMPVNVSFTDGSSILAMNPQRTGGKVTHRDGKQYELMIFDVSNYAKEGQAINLAYAEKVVVEKALNPDGTCDDLTRQEMFDYAVEYVNQLVGGNIDHSKICHYIGRRDPETNKMIVSEYVKQNLVEGHIEKNVSAEINARYEAQRKAAEAREAEQRAKFVAEAEEQNRQYMARENAVKNRRLQEEEFKLVRRGSGLDNYDGVDLCSGDVLRVRNLCKHGKDPSGTYLYSAGVSTTHSEDDVEMLTDGGKYISFTTPVKIEDLIVTREGKRKALELFSIGNRDAAYDSGVTFIGSLDARGTIISKDINQCSSEIRGEYDRVNRSLLARQETRRQKYAQANRAARGEKEIGE